MTAEAAAVCRTWRVGKFDVTLTAPGAGAGAVASVVVEWDPAMPQRPLTESELRQYREGRNAALAELARVVGGPVVVVEG